MKHRHPWRAAADEALQLTSDLVRTQSPSGHERDVAHRLLDYLSDGGVDAEIDANGNLIATVGPAGSRPHVLLNGHMDTVPVLDVDRWDVGAFDGSVDGDWLFGRGSADMKGGLACLAVAVKYMAKIGIQNRVTFTAVVCEESTNWDDRRKGTYHLCKSGRFADVDYAIVAESTNMAVSSGSSGRLLFEAHGKSAHAAFPETGHNAIHTMTSFLAFLAQRADRQRDEIFSRRLPTLTPVQIFGGSAANMVPDFCVVAFDARFGRPSDERKIHAFLTTSVDEFNRKAGDTGHGIACSRTGHRPSSVLDQRDRDLVRQLRRVAEQHGIRKTYRNRFVTDASFIKSICGIPSFVCGPGSEREAHQPNEKVPVRDIHLAPRLYADLCTKPSFRIRSRRSTPQTPASSPRPSP